MPADPQIFRGQRLAQRYRLEGAGPPLVLVHGVGTRLEDLDLLTQRLQSSFRVLRYDLRGHGESERVPGPYSLHDFAADLRELMDGVGFAQAHCYGFSLGALIVQRFALDYPQRVTSLGVISGVGGRSADERAAVLKRAAELAAGGPGAHLSHSVERWFTAEFREAHPEVIEARKARIGANHMPSYAAAYRVLAESDLIDELAAIRQPTLVATGEFDQGSNARMARAMAQRIPNAQLRIIPRLKHALLLEGPDQLAALIGSFIKTGTAVEAGYITQ